MHRSSRSPIYSSSSIPTSPLPGGAAKEEAASQTTGRVGKFRIRAGSLSRSLLNKASNGSRASLHDSSGENSPNLAASPDSADGFPLTPASRSRRHSSTSSVASSSAGLSDRRPSASTSRPPPAAPSASYRRYSRSSWNREASSQENQ